MGKKRQWDPSVKKATRDALSDDGKIDHDEVIDIISSTLDAGGITKLELDNLDRISRSSRLVETRSKMLIEEMVKQYALLRNKESRSNHILPRVHGDKVCSFLRRDGGGKFSHLDRKIIGAGLLMRLSYPSLINQQSTSLCGPSAFLFSLAKDKPGAYVNLAIDLFEKGHAKTGLIEIKPGSDLRNYKPPTGAIHPLDWMMAASIRDSENAFFDYQSVSDNLSAITMPSALASWLTRAGWSEVQNVTNVYLTKPLDSLSAALKLKQNGHRVCLFIAAKMLGSKMKSKGKSSTPNHWVVLTKAISVAGKIHLKVYSWGDGFSEIGPMEKDTFLRNFYGYVSGNPKGK